MRRTFVLPCLSALLCVLAQSPAAYGQQWPTVSPAELTLTQPLIDPAADAEILLWDVTITDAVSGTPYRERAHYLRIKIYNERGRDDASRVDLPFGDDEQIRDVRGRTTSPSGVATELNTNDVRRRTVLEANGASEKVLTFVLPAVVPGSIIEYRWREVRDGPVSGTIVLPFQRQLPVFVATYHIKPLPGYQMRTHVFNPTSTPTKKDEANGYATIQAKLLPAVRREPFMPPDRLVGTWMLIQYLDRDDDLAEQPFWEKWIKQEAKTFADRMKVNDDLTRAAAEATQGATTPREKVNALVRYVREHVRNVDAVPGVTIKRSDNDNAKETLKRGAGSEDDIAVLYTALTRAAGLESYLARMPDRELFVPPPRLKLPGFLSKLATVIKAGDTWTIVDAANEQAPEGRVRWQQEGTYALVLDGKSPNFLTVGVMPPEFSQAQRTATLRLQANGDLEGECTYTFTGHFATQLRERLAVVAQADRERLSTQSIRSYLPNAAIGAFKIENLNDPDKPLIMRFMLSHPGFARSTGSRLELVTAALPMQVYPGFSAATRTRAVMFPFAWSEEDAITIELPEGFEVEGRSTQTPTSMRNGMATHAVTIDVKDRTLSYHRALAVGRGTVVVTVEDYPQLKTFFDTVRKSPSTVLLRRKDERDAR